MPKDAYRVMLNLGFFHNWVTLFLFWKLGKDLEVTKNVKILEFEGDQGEL